MFLFCQTRKQYVHLVTRLQRICQVVSSILASILLREMGSNWFKLEELWPKVLGFFSYFYDLSRVVQSLLSLRAAFCQRFGVKRQMLKKFMHPSRSNALRSVCRASIVAQDIDVSHCLQPIFICRSRWLPIRSVRSVGVPSSNGV